MDYTIEVDEPFAYRPDYFHDLVIKQPVLTDDDCEIVRLALDQHPAITHALDVIHHGWDLDTIDGGQVADYSQFFFYAPRDLSGEFPALIERAFEVAQRAIAEMEAEKS